MDLDLYLDPILYIYTRQYQLTKMYLSLKY